VLAGYCRLHEALYLHSYSDIVSLNLLMDAQARMKDDGNPDP
jgi:hypothetical protein